MWKRRSEACFLLCLNLLNISKEYIYIYIYLYLYPVRNISCSLLNQGEDWGLPYFGVEDTFTLSYITGRSVGIGAYLNRLGQRNIQMVTGKAVKQRTDTDNIWLKSSDITIWNLRLGVATRWILCILRLGRYSLDRVITVGCCRFKSPATWCTGWSFQKLFSTFKEARVDVIAFIFYIVLSLRLAQIRVMFLWAYLKASKIRWRFRRRQEMLFFKVKLFV